MRKRLALWMAWVILLIPALAETALAQHCTPQWLPVNSVSGVDGPVHALTLYDPDGAGPYPQELIVAGKFSAAGRRSLNNLAAWDGIRWRAFGGGLQGTVAEMVASPAGELFIAGELATAGGAPVSRVARWQANAWTSIGEALSGPVRALALLPDGRLLAGGSFHVTGPTYLGVWDGQSWQTFQEWNSGAVYDIAATSSGSVYVSGLITPSAGFSGMGVAKWDGSSWVALPSTESLIHAVLPLDDGSVLVGGGFGVARIEQGQWIAEPGVEGVVDRLRRTGDGSVYACTGRGLFARTTTGWARLTPLVSGSTFPYAAVRDASLDPEGRLVAGGVFFGATGIPEDYIRIWYGAQSTGMPEATRGHIRAMAMVPDGNLIVGGDFSRLAESDVARIALRSGRDWTGFPNAYGPNFLPARILAIAARSTANIVVGGDFGSPNAYNHIARWDGTGWSRPGLGLSGPVYSVALNDRGHILAGGAFTYSNAGGYGGNGTAAYGISLWNGSYWAVFDSAPELQGRIFHAVAFLRDGSIVGAGTFPIVNAPSVDRVVKWTGTSWETLAEAAARSMAVGPSGDLFIGGPFTATPNFPFSRVARWDGTMWQAMGDPGFPVTTIAVDPEGKVIIGGWSNPANPMGWVARWNGWSWAPLSTFNGRVDAVAGLFGDEFAAGGSFTKVNNEVASASFAVFGCDTIYCYPNCDGSTAPTLTIADFACFLERFAGNHHYANCDGSQTLPALTISDFTCFLERFAAGCP